MSGLNSFTYWSWIANSEIIASGSFSDCEDTFTIFSIFFSISSISLLVILILLLISVIFSSVSAMSASISDNLWDKLKLFWYIFLRKLVKKTLSLTV